MVYVFPQSDAVHGPLQFVMDTSAHSVQEPGTGLARIWTVRFSRWSYLGRYQVWSAFKRASHYIGTVDAVAQGSIEVHTLNALVLTCHCENKLAGANYHLVADNIRRTVWRN